MSLSIFKLLAIAAGVFTIVAITSPPPSDQVYRVTFPDGTTSIECPMDSSGSLHGDMYTYYPSGRLQSIVNMCHGTNGTGPKYYDPTPDEPADAQADVNAEEPVDSTTCEPVPQS